MIIYGKFGIYQCAKITETGLYYNVDRAIGLFTKGGRLKDLLTSLTNGQLRNVGRYEDRIKGLKFVALHLNHRTHTIHSFSRTPINQTFFEKDGKQKCVYNYFQEEYAEFCKRNKLDPTLPCVQVGSSRGPNAKPKYFPIECCELKDDVCRQKLSPTLQAMVTRQSSQKPADRFRSIQANINSIDSKVGNVDYLTEFGISLNKNLTEVTGRVLDAPPVLYGNGKELNTFNKGSWMIKSGIEFFEPSKIGGDWAIINFFTRHGHRYDPSIGKNQVDNLMKALVSSSKSFGIDLKTLDQTKTIYNFDYKGKGTLKETLFNKLSPNLKLAIIIIPNDSQIYNEIKTISELKLGIQRNLVTQCLNQEKRYWKDDHLFRQFITNLFLKINPKTGGTNNSIKNAIRPQLMKDKKTMFIGLDVTHPSPTDGLTKSVAACVATFTDHFDKVFKTLKVQEKARKEVVDLKQIVIDFLVNYQKVNKHYPDKIVVFRDGIGEGDFENIQGTELKNVLDACAQLKLDKSKIKIAFIMCQKRHNIRFLADKDENMPPGTVVDRTIVHHKFWEFFVCSHASPMGTARSTKYVVLRDDCDLDADELQKCIYFACYL